MIKATIVADSVSAVNGKRIITFELEYPRFIHAELMTHRLFSRNAASSRAIPTDKLIQLIEEEPAMPVEWGINKAGMQAKEVHPHPASCEWAWKRGAKRAVETARELQGLGLHKQLVNRPLEPFQVMKTIVTATEFDNWFWLRKHTDAQPEIHVLADKMWEALGESTPEKLQVGEWHLPYIETGVSERDIDYGKRHYFVNEDGKRKSIALEEAQKISASCCAQVSYRKLDESLDKALKIYDQLVTMTPVHASPFEHLATPIPLTSNECLQYWCQEFGNLSNEEGYEGVTHTDGVEFWSGNFKGWIQYRQLVKGNACWSYKDE